MGGDKKAKIMAQTTKKKIREGPSVLCRVAFDTPNKKISKNSRGKNRQQFPSFFDHSDSIQIQSWLGQKARRRRFSFKR